MIRMEFQGKDEVLQKLAAVTDNNIRGQIMDDFGMYMEGEITTRFENETGPDGQPWEKSYRAREEGGKTLSKSGWLEDSIARNHTADRLEIGTAVKYAAIHQYGGEIKPKKADKLAFRIGGHLIMTDKVDMPARPYLGFNDDDEAELVNIIHDHWQEALQ